MVKGADESGGSIGAGSEEEEGGRGEEGRHAGSTVGRGRRQLLRRGDRGFLAGVARRGLRDHLHHHDTRR